MKIILTVECDYCTDSKIINKDMDTLLVDENRIQYGAMEKGWGIVKVQDGDSYKDLFICPHCLGVPIN